MPFNLHKLLALLCYATLLLSHYSMPTYYYEAVHLLFFAVLAYQAVTIYRQHGRVTSFVLITGGLALIHTPVMTALENQQWWLLLNMLTVGLIAWVAGRVICDSPRPASENQS